MDSHHGAQRSAARPGPAGPVAANSALWFVVFLLLTLALGAAMVVLDLALRNDVSPQGIVSFELAMTPERSQAILAAWDSKARLIAAFALGLDYLFLLVYSTCLYYACRWWSQAWPQRHWLRRLGAGLAWPAYLCALFDGLENYALWQVLQGESSSVWPAMAGGCAIIKFAILALILSYLLPLLPWRLLRVIGGAGKIR